MADAGRRGVRVCHVITTTDRGGAETQLLRLVAALPPPEWEHHVICLRPEGELAGRLRAAGATVSALGLAPRPWVLFGAARRLRALIKGLAPDLVQTWLYHADLMGALAAGGRPLVWGLRNADLALSASTGLVAWLCARLSRRPAAIVANSQAGAVHHQRRGYSPRRMLVIANGVDVELYRPDPGARAARRAELGLAADDLLVGHVARLDPAKDHAGFLDAARILAGRLNNARFVLMGLGVEPGNPALAGCAVPPLVGRCHLLGPRDDVPAWLAAMDVFAQSSVSEGLPNALAEAMSAGVACAATAVGDSAELLGACGRLAPPGQPFALAEAMEALLRLPAEARTELGARARARIVERYSLAAMAAAYAGLYRELSGRASTRSTSNAQARPGQDDHEMAIS